MAQTKRNERRRIASLARSVTSILVAPGARRELVGATKWCANVAPLDGLPRLGDCWSRDPKRLRKLRPTLVRGARELFRLLHLK